MSKYFTKWLPVEGEIKEGDWINDEGHIWKPGTTLSDTISPKAKKVKLFLCSRDIQVGDRIVADYIIDGTSEGLGVNHIQKEGVVNKEEFNDHWEIISNIGREYAKKDGCYKVIGEISPEAIWVKEGDEFEIHELAYIMGEPPKYPYFHEFKNIVEWDIENMKKYSIGVKCSQCKTFH